MECGCLTSQLTHLRGWEQNELETGVGVARRSQLLEAVPSLQPCSPLRCPGEGRPTTRPCSHPAPLTVPPNPRRSPEPRLGPTGDPTHSHPVAGPACSGRHSAPGGVRGMGGAGGVGGVQGAGPAQSTPPWRRSLGVELWPAVTSQTTGPALAKKRHPMECCLGGVVTRSSSRTPKVITSRHLLRCCDHGFSVPTALL